MLFISNHRIQFSEKQFDCRDYDKKFNVAICALSNSHRWKAVRLSLIVTRKWNVHRLHDATSGVDALHVGVDALHVEDSRSTKSCADCRALCEYDRMQEVAGCSRLHAGCSRLHAGCMQPACSLHAACIRSYAGGCRLQQAACRMQQAACRLHAGCMQPACSLHASLVGHLHKSPRLYIFSLNFNIIY